MEGLYVCVGLILLTVPIIVLGLLLSARAQLQRQQNLLEFLQRRLNALENAVLQLSRRPAALKEEPPIPVEEPAVAAAPVMAPQEPVARPVVPPPLRHEIPHEIPREKAAAFGRMTHAAPPSPPPSPLPPAPRAADQTIPLAPARPAPVPPPLSTPPQGGTPSAPPPAPPRAAAPPRRRLTMEETVVRVLIWIGAVAVALAGIYFVRYSFQHNLLSPAVRVSIGAVFGLALLAGGQLRGKLGPFIAQALSAAGVATLFACILAAQHPRIAIIDARIAFVLMAIVTGAAVTLSLQQGPFVAALGLIGGFLTPALLNTDERNAGALFGYLFLLQVGLVAVTRFRGWSLLAGFTALASMLWAALWMGVKLAQDASFDYREGRIVGAFILGAVVTTLLSSATAGAEERWSGKSLAARLLTWGTTLVGLGLAAALLGISGFSTAEWVFVGLLAAGCMVLGRIRVPYEGLAWVASALVLGLLTVGIVRERNMYFRDGPFDVRHWAVLVSVFGTILAGGCYACLWGAAAPVRWAATSVVSTLGFVILAYFGLVTGTRSPVWGALAAGLAALYGAATVPIAARRATMRTGEATLTVLLLGVYALLVMAVPMVFEYAPLTATWSVLVPLAILAARQWRVPALGLAALVPAALVAVRLLAAPLYEPESTGHLFAWGPLLLGYGVPLLAFAAAGWLLRREPTLLARSFEVAPLALAFAFLSLLIRRFFHPDTLQAAAVTFREAGTYTIAWLLLGWGVFALGNAFRRRVLAYGGQVVLGIAFFQAALSVLLILHPDWATAIGPWPVFNPLLYTYGLPTLILLLLAADLVRRNCLDWARLAGVLGQILLWALVSLEVRHFFHRTNLTALDVTFREAGTYTLAWLVLGWSVLALRARWPQWLLLGAEPAMLGVALAWAVLVQLLVPVWAGQIEATPLWNSLLQVYALPLALLPFLALDLRRRKVHALANWTGGLAQGLLWALLTVEVRHLFQHGALLATTSPGAEALLNGELAMGFWELGTYALVWLALGYGLWEIGRRLRSIILEGGGLVIVVLALAEVVGIPGLSSNPRWAHWEIAGPVVFNSLLYVYGLPAAAAIAFAYRLRRTEFRPYAAVPGLAGLVLVFILVSLEVRHAYQGRFLDGPAAGGAEMFTYSIAWIVLGLVLTALGVLTRGPILRWSSLVVMFFAVGKVFIVDTANLPDLLRVLSYVGLGISLLGLALCYQRFVFARKPEVRVGEDPGA